MPDPQQTQPHLAMSAPQRGQAQRQGCPHPRAAREAGLLRWPLRLCLQEAHPGGTLPDPAAGRWAVLPVPQHGAPSGGGWAVTPSPGSVPRNLAVAQFSGLGFQLSVTKLRVETDLTDGLPTGTCPQTRKLHQDQGRQPGSPPGTGTLSRDSCPPRRTQEHWVAGPRSLQSVCTGMGRSVERKGYCSAAKLM